MSPRRRPDPTRPSRRGSRGIRPLQPGDRVAVVGAGPAGTFFAHLFLRLADRAHLPVTVDIFDPRSFRTPGPGGCAHCGGIVSESLVQILAAEGLRVPPGVIQRGIGSYVVHMDVGDVRIESPRAETRIAALFRGNGPRGGAVELARSFDGYLLEQAVSAGARHVPRLVTGTTLEKGGRTLHHPDGEASGPYALVALATGINSRLLEGLPDRPLPERSRTYICELAADPEAIERRLGGSMHVFLLDLPRLEFAALIPKGDHVTLCMLGEGIDDDLVRAFLDRPEVRRCIPPGTSRLACQCSPFINVRNPLPAFDDRLVLVGDAGVTRLYKDGIGAAFRTAKAAAQTAVLFGVAPEDFRRHYLPLCRRIEADNRIGRAIFAGTELFKRLRFLRRGVLRMAAVEQATAGMPRRMSAALWNLFTGSAPYRTILYGALHPAFAGRLAWSLLAANAWSRKEMHHG